MPEEQASPEKQYRRELSLQQSITEQDSKILRDLTMGKIGIPALNEGDSPTGVLGQLVGKPLGLLSCSDATQK